MDNNNENNYNDITFFKLWKNIVINRVIFKYVALYKKNRVVKFNNLKTLKSYKEKQFITTLKYINHINKESETLSKGDLPEYGALKELDLSLCCCPITSGDTVPYGVQIIHFGNTYYKEIQLSELPSSITTITNVLLKKPYVENQIPSNITSISFSDKIDPNEILHYIKLTSSIVN